MAETRSKHSVVMTERENISVTGVIDVISFDEETIIAETEAGALILRGKDLHVNGLSLEKGELDIDGHIDSLAYEDQSNYGKNKTSFLSKIFK